MAAGDPLHHRRQDAACLPLGVTACLLVDLADERRAVVAELLLELAQEDLASLTGAQAGDPLELADVLLLRGLELARLVVEVPLPVLEGRLAALDLADAHVEGLLLAQQPLLDTGDLRPALAQLRVDLRAHGLLQRGAVAGPIVGHRVILPAVPVSAALGSLRHPCRRARPGGDLGRPGGGRPSLPSKQHDDGRRDNRRDCRSYHDLHLSAPWSPAAGSRRRMAIGATGLCCRETPVVPMSGRAPGPGRAGDAYLRPTNSPFGAFGANFRSTWCSRLSLCQSRFETGDLLEFRLTTASWPPGQRVRLAAPRRNLSWTVGQNRARAGGSQAASAEAAGWASPSGGPPFASIGVTSPAARAGCTPSVS